MKCKTVNFDAANWELLDKFHDRTVFQTREWIDFISQTQAATPLLDSNCIEGNDIAGYFTGLIFNRLGVKILGSSFPGWTTPYIGFNMVPGASRQACANCP